MRNIIVGIFVIINLLKADNLPPTFLPIDITEDFYSDSEVYLEVQVMDQSTIKDVILYYRFSDEDSFTNILMEKEMYYVGEILASEVESGRLEYYFFARDEFGNQSTWPQNGEKEPESHFIMDPLITGISLGNITIDLLTPIANETIEKVPIIIISLYDPEEIMDLLDIHLILDNDDVTKSAFKSIDMITYIPDNHLGPGLHEVKVQLENSKGVYSSKEFNFTIAEASLSEVKKFDWRKEFKFKGNFGYNSNFNEFYNKDRPENKPIDSHKFNLSAKFKIGEYKVKTSLLVNTHLIDESARMALLLNQPSNRLKFGMSSPYIDLKYGDFSTEFSEFSLKGTRIRGIYSRFKLGPLRTSIVFGNTKEFINSTTEVNIDSTSWTLIIDSTAAVYDSSFVNHMKGTSSRKLKALRTELEYPKFNFGINALTSYDNLEEYDLAFDELYDQYTFLGNAVISSDVTIRLNNNKTQIKFETAISIMNDLMGESIDSLAENLELSESQINDIDNFLTYIGDKVGFNVNSDLMTGNAEGRGISLPLPSLESENNFSNLITYLRKNIIKQGTYRFLFKSPVEFKENSFDLQVEYKRVPMNFISLGNSSVQTDIQGLKSSIKGRLFENNLSINFGYDNENDNIMGETPDSKLKSTTTTSISTSGGFGISFLGLPSINYAMRLMNREGNSVENNSLMSSNKTVTHTISPSYKFEYKKGINVNVGGNIMLMTYNDNLYNPMDSIATNTNFTTGSYNGSIGLRFDSPLSVNVGSGLSINTPADPSIQSTLFLVFNSKLSYKFWEKKLSTSFGINFVKGSKSEDVNKEGKIDNKKITLKAGIQYKFSKNMSMGLNMDLISLIDTVTPNNNFSELKGKLKFKVGF